MKSGFFGWAALVFNVRRPDLPTPMRPEHVSPWKIKGTWRRCWWQLVLPFVWLRERAQLCGEPVEMKASW